MMSDLPSVVGVDKLEYADDVALVCSGDHINKILPKLQKQLDALVAWTQDWGLLINPSKIEAMVFTNKKKLVEPPSLCLPIYN